MKILSSKGKIDSKTKAFLAVPSYGGIAGGFVTSLFGSKEILSDAGIRSDLEIFDGNCHVDDARNRLVRDFLETDCTDLVFIDTDLKFDPNDLLELILADKDVIGGVCRLKQDKEEYAVRFIPETTIISDEYGHVAVEAVGTAFLKIKRHVLERLYKTVRKFKDASNLNRKKLPLLFERTLEGNTRWGGDYTFCRKWRNLGGKIHIIPEMYFAHEGTKEWGGCVGSYLRKKYELTDDFIIKIINKVKAGTVSEKDITRLSEMWDNEWQTPEDVLIALSMIAKNTEGKILECGSGLSTLIMAASTDKQIDVLEHNKIYADNIKKYIKLCGLENINLICCDIKDGWYDHARNGEQYSFIYVDGPPHAIGRDKFAEQMKKNISDNCIVVADDCDLKQVETWRESIGIEYKQYNSFRNRPFIIGKTHAG